MKIAAKIIEQALLKAFGLKNLLFVYSGRRGIHCWVCDTKARSYGKLGNHALGGIKNPKSPNMVFSFLRARPRSLLGRKTNFGNFDFLTDNVPNGSSTGAGAALST